MKLAELTLDLEVKTGPMPSQRPRLYKEQPEKKKNIFEIYNKSVNMPLH